MIMRSSDSYTMYRCVGDSALLAGSYQTISGRVCRHVTSVQLAVIV